jgi:Protein of unknown function (DUF2442)
MSGGSSRLAGVFAPIRESRELFEQVRVNPETRTVEWPGEVDLDPDVLYGRMSPHPASGSDVGESVPGPQLGCARVAARWLARGGASFRAHTSIGQAAVPRSRRTLRGTVHARVDWRDWRFESRSAAPHSSSASTADRSAWPRSVSS